MVHVTGITQKSGVIKVVVVYCWSAGRVVIRLLASSGHSSDDGSGKRGSAVHATPSVFYPFQKTAQQILQKRHNTLQAIPR